MMMIMTVLWRVVSLWLCVALVSWNPGCYVDCTEQPTEAQRPQTTQDEGAEEGPGEQVAESWASRIRPSSEEEEEEEEEEELLNMGDSECEGEAEPGTQGLDEEEQYAEAVEAEKPGAEGVEPVPENNMPESVPESVPEPVPSPGPEKQLPEASLHTREDPGSASHSESPSPSSAPAAEPIYCPSTLRTQELTLNSLADGDDSAVPAPEPGEADLAHVDCESGEANPYDDTSPPVVLENTSNAHTAGTITHTDPPLSPPAGHSTQHLGANTSHGMKEQDLSSAIAAEKESTGGSKDPEDILTFDEWKRIEAEKEKSSQATHTSTEVISHAVKKVQKNFNNYASVECGAKLLGANPEAKSTSAILKENMDLYMLNPCSNKIWFIIELCEPIQVKQLDIANFELFSSTPKDFLVSISDRYPTNKWLKLGTFHARDERTVQTFPLDEHLYAKYVKMFTKYIKVELLSHFGSEHFCPLSLIRVFGTSMVEEFDETDPSERTEDQDDLDSLPGYAAGEVKSSNNLIGSATDVILNMVNNIAVNVLGGGPDMEGNFSQELNMTEPASPPETITQTTTAEPTPITDTEDVPDPENLASADPSLKDPTVLETPSTDATQPELVPAEEAIVTPLQEKEEEEEEEEEDPISSTITLLIKDDHEEERNKELEQPRSESPSSSPSPNSSSSSSSSSCTPSPTLQEYLHQKSAALLAKYKQCQTLETLPSVYPDTPAPSWEPPPSLSTSPEPPGPLRPLETPGPVQSEGGAGPAETPATPTDLQASLGPDAAPLEPSQTLTFSRTVPSATQSPVATPSPGVETVQLSAKVQEEAQSKEEEEEEEEEGGHVPASLGGPPSSSDGPRQTPMAEPPGAGVSPPQLDGPAQTPPEPPAPPQTPPSAEDQESGAVATDAQPAPGGDAQPEPSTDAARGSGDLPEDTTLPSPPAADGDAQFLQTAPLSSSSSSSSEFYPDLPSGAEQGAGSQVHGGSSSSQKESVFMRLNNRIKALEMNMSLSGRYLEQLSQRYRKQMEEMQRAFNKTIVKLQNTSRIAEQQDLRQTESIVSLQAQLQNITQLVLNLSVRVSQLQSEVSDRHNYLLLSVLLCVLLGLLLSAGHRRITAPTPTPATEADPPGAQSYTYCCAERQFTSCQDAGLSRSASYPLLPPSSYQLHTNPGPEILLSEETLQFSTDNRKKGRDKPRSESLAPALANGAVVSDANPPPPSFRGLLHPCFRDSPSEGSSEGSSHSDEPSLCGMASACTRICDGLPPARTRAGKRAPRRRRSKPMCAVVDMLQAPGRDKGGSLPPSTFQL